MTLRQATGLDIGFSRQVVELAVMLPNTIDTAMMALEHRDLDDCHQTGSICFLLLNITTANTPKDLVSGSFIQIQLPTSLKVLGNQCWAIVGQESNLVCELMSDKKKNE